MTLAATLPHRPDAERVRLRLGTAFIEHRDDLWPKGEPAATNEWIRAHVDELLATLERAFDIGRHGRPASLLRIPHRLHWLLWFAGRTRSACGAARRLEDHSSAAALIAI